MPVDADTFRHVMGTFATGCTVVTLPGDPPHGMTANAVSSVSLDPPLCLVCVDHETQTFELLDGEVDGFALNVLAADQQDLAEHFANMAPVDDNPFERETATTKETGATVWTDSLAYLDCRVSAGHVAGDHTIYVGEVQAAETLRDDAPPLAFYRGQWETIGE